MPEPVSGKGSNKTKSPEVRLGQEEVRESENATIRRKFHSTRVFPSSRKTSRALLIPRWCLREGSHCPIMGSERALMRASWYPSAPAAGVFSLGQLT